MALNLSLAGNWLVHLVLFIFILFTLLRARKANIDKVWCSLLGILSLPFLVVMILEFSWIFSLTTLLHNDLMIVYAFLSIGEAILVVLLVSHAWKSKHLLLLF